MNVFSGIKSLQDIAVGSGFGFRYDLNYFVVRIDLGFKTFDQLWSEEYDQFEFSNRWNQIKLTINHIIEHGYDRNLANEIVQYNYNHLQQLMAKEHG